MTTPALPPGFELETTSSSTPPLPAGFEMVGESGFDESPGLEIDIVGGIPESQVSNAANNSGFAQMISGQAPAAEPNFTDEMSGSELFRAGLGKSLVDTAYGVGQSLTGAVLRPAKLIAQSTALTSPERSQRALDILSAPGEWFEERAAERRAADAPLMATTPGLAGNITGSVAQIVGPGAALKGTSLGSALLPASIRGNIVQGGVLGGLQPSTGTQDQAINTSLGAAFGGIGSALVRAAGGTVNGLRNLLSRSGLTSAEKRAGEAILREATNPSGLVFQESAVPGVQRTLGESTQDPGLMALEGTMRARNRGMFDPTDIANNAARIQQLERIAGTDADMAAAIEARDLASSGLRDAAFQEGDIAARQAQEQSALMMGSGDSLAPLREQVSSMVAQSGGRPSVQAAVRDVDRALQNAGDSVGSLYQVRQYIGDLMEGKAGGDKSYAKAATRELMQIREALDEQLAQRAPSFPEYLNAYRGASKPINRMEVGREIIERASGAIPDQLGNRSLTPAGMMRATTDLDAISAKATGFKKAKAADILSPDDISSIKAIQDDLIRQAARQRSATAGSQTAERTAIGERLAKQSVLTRVPGVGQIFEHFEKIADDALQERLAFLIANPEQARRVIAALPKEDQKPVRQMLAQLSMATSRAIGTKKEAAE